MILQETPRANRLHIGLYGKRNSGKSSLINALTGQNVALVSPIAGTTTDPVYKGMELPGLGPCVFIDTAGFDDVGPLGELRVMKTKEAVAKTDIALLLFSGKDWHEEAHWAAYLTQEKIPFIPVVSQSDCLLTEDKQQLTKEIEHICQKPPIFVSVKDKTGLKELQQALLRQMPEDFAKSSIVGNLVDAGDSVLLVMPQDIQAPKGRLILPQVQTIRDLLEKNCVITCVTTDGLAKALATLKEPPKLIITDSQAFGPVFAQKPAASAITSFSVLFANYKGDAAFFAAGAEAVEKLTENSRVLIAEACTHAPQTEDIGRVKIPRLLRQKVGQGLRIDMVSGNDFPLDLTPYHLIIHCGACMFNRKYVLSRIAAAKEQGIPMTNYGMLLAYLQGILPQVIW